MKHIGEMIIGLTTALSMGIVGGLSSHISDLPSCRTKNSEQVGLTSSVGIGFAISLFCLTLLSKLSQSSNPKISQNTEMIGIIITSIVLVILGSLSVNASQKENINLENPIETATDTVRFALLQKKLGTIILGLGIGILIPVVIKFILTLTQSDNPFISKIHSLVTMFALLAVAIFTSVIGIWSWSNFNACEALSKQEDGTSSPDIEKGKGARTANGFFTVIATLMALLIIINIIILLFFPMLANRIGSLGQAV